MTSSKLITRCVVLWCAANSTVASADERPPTSTPDTWHLALKLDWTLFLGPGAGGSVSLDVANHELTLMALGTKLAPPFRDMLLSGASDVEAPLNLGVEVGYSYFLRADRKWWFAGGLVSADQYRNAGASLDVLYVVPRIGARVPLGRRFFIEPSIGAAVRVMSSGPVDGMDARRVAPVFLLPLGVHFAL